MSDIFFVYRFASQIRWPFIRLRHSSYLTFLPSLECDLSCLDLRPPILLKRPNPCKETTSSAPAILAPGFSDLPIHLAPPCSESAAATFALLSLKTSPTTASNLKDATVKDTTSNPSLPVRAPLTARYPLTPKRDEPRADACPNIRQFPSGQAITDGFGWMPDHLLFPLNAKPENRAKEITMIQLGKPRIMRINFEQRNAAFLSVRLAVIRHDERALSLRLRIAAVQHDLDVIVTILQAG